MIPLGVPVEPLVNKISAGVLALVSVMYMVSGSPVTLIMVAVDFNSGTSFSVSLSQRIALGVAAPAMAARREMELRRSIGMWVAPICQIASSEQIQSALGC